MQLMSKLYKVFLYKSVNEVLIISSFLDDKWNPKFKILKLNKFTNLK